MGSLVSYLFLHCPANAFKPLDDVQTDLAVHKNNGFGFDMVQMGFVHIPILLTTGPLRDALDLTNKSVDVLAGRLASVERGDSQDMMPGEVLNILLCSLLPCFGMLGFWEQGVQLLSRLKADVWDSPMFESLFNEIGAIVTLMWGRKAAVALQLNLWTFVFKGTSAVDTAKVLRVLEAREEVVDLAQVHISRSDGYNTTLLPAALAAERLDRDDLAEYFAEQGEEVHLQADILAACKAVRARVLQRKGDRAGAVQLWEAGATSVLEQRLPLFAIRLGQDCGGEEGERLIEAGRSAMGADRAEFEGLGGLMAPPVL